MSDIIWDVFISHASEDKKEVVYPLSRLLILSGIRVWLDVAEITVGDSLHEKIDLGLSRSQFGIVILSHSFFSKDWPKSELDGLMSKEIQAQKVILPVWHKINYEEVRRYSPLLAGRIAANTENGLHDVKEKLIVAMNRIGRNRPSYMPIYEGRLNKKELMNFPEGSYIVSNIFSSFDRKPMLETQIGSYDSREQLWEKVKSTGADGRKCSVYKNYDDYFAYKQNMIMWEGLWRLEERK